MPKKAIVMLTYICNAIFRFRSFTCQWKTAKVIMLAKLGKHLGELKSYRPIFYFKRCSKSLRNYFVNDVHCYNRAWYNPYSPIWIPWQTLLHWTGSENCQWYTIFSRRKKFYPAIFLDEVRNLIKYRPKAFYTRSVTTSRVNMLQIFKSYLIDCSFHAHYGAAIFSLHPISAGVPQGRVLGPLLHVLYTSNIPATLKTHLASFADDTAILAPHEDYIEAINILKKSVNKVLKWTRKWKIKLNGTKYTRQLYHPILPRQLKKTVVPIRDTVKYLGIHFDKRLTWNSYITAKRELRIRFRSFYRLTRAPNHLSLVSDKEYFSSFPYHKFLRDYIRIFKFVFLQ